MPRKPKPAMWPVQSIVRDPNQVTSTHPVRLTIIITKGKS